MQIFIKKNHVGVISKNWWIDEEGAFFLHMLIEELKEVKGDCGPLFMHHPFYSSMYIELSDFVT